MSRPHSPQNPGMALLTVCGAAAAWFLLFLGRFDALGLSGGTAGDEDEEEDEDGGAAAPWALLPWEPEAPEVEAPGSITREEEHTNENKSESFFFCFFFFLCCYEARGREEPGRNKIII